MSLLKPLNPRFNRQYPLAPGCVAFWPFAEANGNAVDVVNGIKAVPQTSAGRIGTVRGLAGNCGPLDNGFYGDPDSRLNLNLPITLACAVRYVGTPTTNHPIASLIHSTGGSSPFVSYSISTNGANNFQLAYNDGGFYGSAASTTNVSTELGSIVYLVAVFTTGLRTLYRNGYSIVSNSSVVGNPTYGTGASLRFGFYAVGSGLTLNMHMVCAGVWNRAFSDSEVRLWSADPFGVCRVPVRRRSYSLPAVGTSRLLKLRRRAVFN